MAGLASERIDYKMIKNKIKGLLEVEKVRTIAVRDAYKNNVEPDVLNNTIKNLAEVKGEIQGLRYAIKVISQYNI